MGRQFVCFLPYHLDVNLMKKEACYLLGRKSFKSFHASRRKVNNFTRHTNFHEGVVDYTEEEMIKFLRNNP